jgi:hypothetical protein
VVLVVPLLFCAEYRSGEAYDSTATQDAVADIEASPILPLALVNVIVR